MNLFRWRPAGWKPSSKNTGLFGTCDWPIFGYLKMRWPIRNKGSKFPQTWLYDMLPSLRKNTVDYVKKKKADNQIELAEHWQEHKECLFKKGSKRYSSARTYNLEIDLDTWNSYNLVDSDGKQIDADFKKAIENDETYYLPARQKIWCRNLLRVDAAITEQKKEGQEHYWELKDDNTKDRSWLTKQRSMSKEGKLSQQRLDLLNSGDVGKAFDTQNRTRSQMLPKIEKPEGSWQDPNTGQWCLKCSQCDKIRRVKYLRSLLKRNVCMSCGLKKRSLQTKIQEPTSTICNGVEIQEDC